MNCLLSSIALIPFLASALVVPPDLQPRHNVVKSEVCRIGSVVDHLNFIPQEKLASVKAWCANQTATVSAEPTVNITRTILPLGATTVAAGTVTKTFTRPWTTKTVTYTRTRGNRRPFLAARTAEPQPAVELLDAEVGAEVTAGLEKRTFGWPFNKDRNGNKNSQSNGNDDNDDNNDDNNRRRVPSYWRDAASSLIPVFCSCLDTPWQTHSWNGTWTKWHTMTETATADQTTVISDVEATTTVDADIEATVAVTVSV
ncbi:hypothetical protein TWF696_005022 [Orbilia brochopaga]|uniref:Uncharacterized protein n=1 Tax=Orbilia brochopaga TaxID=3140254 RepID=A0AAV9UZJ6_9PEZI